MRSDSVTIALHSRLLGACLVNLYLAAVYVQRNIDL